MAKVNHSRHFYVLISGFLLLLAYILFFDNPSSPGSGAKLEKVFTNFKPMKVLEVQLLGKENVKLQREDKGWFITEPKRYRTDLSAMVSFFKNIANITLQRRITPKDGKLKQYGLDKPSFTIVLKTAKERKILIVGTEVVTGKGETSKSVTYVQVMGEKEVGIVESFTIERLIAGVKYFRFKQFFSFDRSSINFVEFNYLGRKLSFQKDKAVWYANKRNGKKKRVSRVKLMGFLGDFYSMPVDNLIADKANPAQYGITGTRNYIMVKGGGLSKKISFGSSNKGFRYCAVAGNKQLFEVYSYKFERLNKKLGDFLDK